MTAAAEVIAATESTVGLSQASCTATARRAHGVRDRSAKR